MLTVQNPPPVEEQDFQQQSHATGLDHTQACQLNVLTAIFLVRLMERTKPVKRKGSYTLREEKFVHALLVPVYAHAAHLG